MLQVADLFFPGGCRGCRVCISVFAPLLVPLQDFSNTKSLSFLTLFVKKGWMHMSQS